jgi:hypothetical protein
MIFYRKLAIICHIKPLKKKWKQKMVRAIINCVRYVRCIDRALWVDYIYEYMT